MILLLGGKKMAREVKIWQGSGSKKIHPVFVVLYCTVSTLDPIFFFF